MSRAIVGFSRIFQLHGVSDGYTPSNFHALHDGVSFENSKCNQDVSFINIIVNTVREKSRDSSVAIVTGY
jgi:hypothetical protein